MKKFLLTAVLIVAVLTSLTAGTLAAYTQTQTIEQANAVETIKFKFNKDGSEGFASPVSLVPGTSKMYRVTVKNESEVPVVFKTAALLTGDATFLTYLVTGWFSDYAGTSPVSNTFTLAVNESTNIYLKVKFTDTDDNDAEVALSQTDPKASLKVDITGTYAGV